MLAKDSYAAIVTAGSGAVRKCGEQVRYLVATGPPEMTVCSHGVADRQPAVRTAGQVRCCHKITAWTLIEVRRCRSSGHYGVLLDVAMAQASSPAAAAKAHTAAAHRHAPTLPPSAGASAQPRPIKSVQMPAL